MILRKLLYSFTAFISGAAGVCLAAETAKTPTAKDKPAPTAESAAGGKPSKISSSVVVEPTTSLTDKESRELSFAAGRADQTGGRRPRVAQILPLPA